MEELYRQIWTVLHSMWRYRWYAVAVTWSLSVAGWGLVATMPDKYESFARIYVDTDPMLKPLLKGISVDVNIQRQINVMQRTLSSRPNLEKVIRMTDLDLSVSSAREMESLIEKLASNITVTAEGGELVRVSYLDKDPQMAKRVVQALMTIFVESNLGRSRKDLAGARRFIDDQIREYELQLEAAEKRLADFKRENMGLLPGDQNYFSQVAKLKSDYEAAQASLDDLITRRDELKRQLADIPQYLTVTSPMGPLAPAGPMGAGPMGATPAAGAGSDLAARIATIEQTLTEMSLHYTDKHPDVVRLKRQLATLRERYQEQQGEMMAGPASPTPGVGNTTVSNPVYEQTKLDIIDAEAEIATLRPRVEKARKAYEDMQNRARTVPVVEAELARLDRDYNVIKKNYEELLTRREKARIEQNIETKSDKVVYNMIEPPQVPLKPSSPNRPLYLSMILVLGLGAGLGVAFIMTQIRVTFPTVQSLRDAFALPVLGAVSAVVSDEDRRRRLLDLSIFGATMIGLFLAYGGVMAIEVLRRA